MAKPITTRNTFRATLESIRPTIDRLGSVDDARAIAVASMILADADRIVATITADDAPDWVERECAHGDWAAVAESVDALRDAFTGRTLDDIRADTRATERVLARITGTHAAAAKTIARNAAVHAALAEIDAPARPARGKR